MRDPYELAEDQLVNDLNAGLITKQDFHDEMRSMRDELEREAEEAAQDAYDEVMGRY